MIINKIKDVLKRFSDANLCSDAAREIISVHIYNELKDKLEKKDERGL